MPSPTGLSIKSIGLIAAGVLALIFTGIIVVSMMLATPAPTNNQSDAFPDPDEIIDIEQTQSGGSMFVTMVDQNDPTRVSSTLRADRFEPIGEGRRRLDQPESWIYLEDGRAVRVNADTATMLMPDPNQAPESGTLEGNIVIRAYDSTPAPGEPAPESQDPTLTARFVEPLEFERRYLRMRSPGHFEIESEQVDFAGTDLTIIFNNLKNRIELIDVLQGDEIVFHTDRIASRDPSPADPSTTSPETQTTSSATPATQSPAQSTKATTTATQPASGSTPAPIDVQRYRIALESDVRASLAQSGQVDADMLTLWATFIDGQIPENAIRRIALAAQENEPDVPATPSQTSPSTQTDASSVPAQASAAPSQASTQDLTITWSGPMRIRPIDDEIPSELQSDQLALRLDSIEGSGIAMRAPDRGFTGQAKTLTYFATRAIAELEGKPTDTGIIKLAVQDTGTLYAESLHADLTSGQIDMRQRGSISTQNADPEQIASVRWKDRAKIKFAIDNSGALTQRLESARFEGAAIAEQAGNSIGARAINATLNPELPPASALTQIVLNEGVIASADRRTLTGKTVTIDFEPDSDPNNPPHPVRVASIGSSMGRTPDLMLRSDDMHAKLIRDASGKTLIETASALGSVTYRDSSRTSASADELQADGINEIITLTGPDAQVAQGGSTITGPHITLRATRRSIEVVGPGTFDHDIALDESPDAQQGLSGHVNARWAQSMRFEDTLGTVECEGDVRVISTPDALTRDTLKADRVTINLTPMPTNDPVANARAPKRELISARASGRAQPGTDPVPASVESRTYDANDPELAVGVLYLEGAQILADNTSQTLTVPGAGTLLILDRQQDDTTEQSDDRPIDGAGLTRFNWNNRMVLDRPNGKGTFTGSVAVDHKSLVSNKRATLNTDSLVAFFETEQTDDQSQMTTGTNTLRSAIAEGKVRFVYAGSELLSDRAEYDAIEDSLFASALDTNRVSLYRNDGSAPTSARTIFWDLAKDQLRINAPSPVRTTPGG